MTRNRLILFCAFLFFILVIRIFTFYQNKPVIPVGKPVTFEGEVVSEPVLRESSQSFQLETSLGMKVYVTGSQNENYPNGERLQVIGSLEKRLLNNNREIYTVFLPQISHMKSSNTPVLAVASFVRQKITGFYNRTLPPDSASLLLGIVFGIKGNISKSFMENLQAAGVLHVIAASGMNVTLIGGFLSSILVLFLKRQWAIALTILGLVFYALLAGFQASIVRATIMGALVFSAQILGRQYLAAYGLFLAGFLMLFISPDLLLDIGFQLSFLATAGLLYLRPLIDSLFSKRLIKKLPVAEDLTTTIAAQAATLPVLFVNFGSYSPWSIIANALVLWTIPILMILGGIGAILSFILEPLGRFLIYLCLPLLWYFEKVVKLFPVISSDASATNTHWTLVLGYYLILLSFIIWHTIRSKRHERKNK
jgi:competence protein ComEC